MSSTPAHDAHAQENTLANRYGVAHRRASRRHLRMALGAPALAVAVALAVMIGLNVSVGQVRAKDVGYQIHDAGSASVTFQVSVPEGVAAECDVVVLDAQAAPVGFRTVRIDPGPEVDPGRDAMYTVDVRTVVRGVTGLVDGCRTA